MENIHIFLLFTIFCMCLYLYFSIVPCKESFTEYDLPKNIEEAIEKITDETQKKIANNIATQIETQKLTEHIRRMKQVLTDAMNKAKPGESVVISNTNSIETLVTV